MQEQVIIVNYLLLCYNPFIGGQEYKFNFVGLFAVALHMKIQRRRAFYCAEFVKYAMKKAQIKNNLPDIVKPEDFLNLENIRLEYKGALKQYKVEELPTLNVANL